MVIAISLVLLTCLMLSACTANVTSAPEIPRNSGEDQAAPMNTSTQVSSDVIADETCLSGGPSDTQLEYWEIDEFEDWMEQQRDQIQKLADNKDKSFYYKDDNGSYVCREWTQEDVDSLYESWQDQLALMKEGYHLLNLWNCPTVVSFLAHLTLKHGTLNQRLPSDRQSLLYLTVRQLIWAILIPQTLLPKLCRNAWSSKSYWEIYHRKKRIICSTMVPLNNKFLTLAGSR